jgi:hypothetical protein
MGQHLAVFHFATGGLWVRGEVLGESWCLERDGFTMLVELPSGQEDFGISEPAGEEDHGSFIPLAGGGGEALIKVGIRRGREVLAATVHVFQIAVLVESSVSSQDPPEADMSDGQHALETAYEVAIEVADDFLKLLRTEGDQFGIGVSHEPPRNAGPGWLLDVEAGGWVRNVGLPQPLVAHTGSEESALSRDALGDIIDRLREGATPPTSDELLADARATLAGRGVESKRSASHRDVRRAVLLAAIASEVKIKDTLRQKTPEHRRELAEVILKNWREVDIAIAELPHRPMKGAIGRSLHEDDPALFDAVRTLFTRRNGIAHRGEVPTLEDARESVGAAFRLAAWLDGLPAP